MSFLFSSESVSEGHPDKVCDQISDAVLDACLSQDPHSRVACEIYVTTGLVVVGGEISTLAVIDVREIVRQTLIEIGYTDPNYGIDGKSCGIMVTLNKQSPDIAQGVNEGEGVDKGLGAGDQGMMFGTACRQTPELMPLPISLSHRLMFRCSVLRKSGEISYLRPDAKAQVTVEYSDDREPLRVDAVVISHQHNPEISQEDIRKDLIDKVIKVVIPESLLDEKTRFFINPTGRFVEGGPHADVGLTGRKIIVDTYGGWGAHGGGAFSGKDGTKVDRSGAYMARYVAKNLVASGLAEEVEIQVAYAIGVSEPVSILVNTNKTGVVSDKVLEGLVREHFDFTAAGIINQLKLREPGFRSLAAYGHMGREELGVAWEQPDKAEILKQSASKFLASTE